MDSIAPSRLTTGRKRQRIDDQQRSPRPFANVRIIIGKHPEAIAASRSSRCGFIVFRQISGDGAVTNDDGSIALSSGETLVIARPTHSVWHPEGPESDCLIATGGPAFTLRFLPRPITAVKLGALHPVALLLSDFLGQLKDFIPAADPIVTQKLAEVLADLVDTAIEEANGSRFTRKFVARLAQAESHLDDPEFDARALAEKCGITLRSLQKRLKPFKTTPRRWISERRLERIRKMLDDPALANLTAQKIAFRCGLRDFSHFIHAFKDAFGVPPGRYRR